MNWRIFTVLSIVCTLTAFADAETNSTYLKIVQASNNVQSVINTLPEVEKLWPQEPDTYLKTVNQAIHTLGGSQSNANARQSLANTFDGMMQKVRPTNTEAATSWVEAKCDNIEFCFNFDEIKKDNSKWIEIANFIGEVRSEIVPNYKNKGFLLNGFGFTDQQIAQNQDNLAKDRLQAMLRQTDGMLTFDLLYNCHYYFPFSNPTNADFIKHISDTAHLTPEERVKF